MIAQSVPPNPRSMFSSRSVKKLAAYVQFALAALLIQPQLAVAKCISLSISLDGEIVRVRSDVSVRVEVRSATVGDSSTDVREESKIENSHFHTTAWFNTTSNIISAETCDRLPEIVVVKLMSGDRELDRQRLKIKSDFRQTKDGDYELKRHITLRVPGKYR